MEKQSRRDLLEVIDQQKEQLGRYEARLKDMVRAYKGITKEKEALESSLKTITAAINEEKEKGKHEDESAVSSQQPTEDEGGISDVESIASTSSCSVNQGSTKPKLAALSTSLATLAQEKAASETKYLADKRRLRKEKEELLTQINNLKASEDSLKTSLEETKSKLIIEKHERDQEINNNKIMMKEMQKLLTDERISKEKLEDEVRSLNAKIITTEAAKAVAVQDSQAQELQEQLDSTRQQLARTEEQLRNQKLTKVQIDQLQQELSQVRHQHQEQLRAAEIAREEAELRAIHIQKQQEERVGNLESSLQDLSSTVATYEKLRESDQADISRMRVQIDSLSSENSALARAASTEPPPSPSVSPVRNASGSRQETNSLNINSTTTKQLVDLVIRIKQSLSDRSDCSRSELEEAFALPVRERADQSDQAMDWRLKCESLQRKIEQMEISLGNTSKLSSHSQSSVMNPSSKEDVDLLSSQLEELKQRIKKVKSELHRSEEENRKKTAQLVSMKQKFEQEADVQRLEHKKEVGVLRFELQQHRERSLALLEEKEGEIQRLRAEMEESLDDAFYSPERREKSPFPVPVRKISCEIADMNAGPSSSGPPLHYIQELSRKEVEIKDLRTQQFQTETTLRELQLVMSTKEEKYQEKIDELESTVSRLERMTTAEGANLEYLKNVVLNYMLSTDNTSRNHMLKAIAAVLRLSGAEVGRVVEHNKAWWWSYAGKQQSTSKRSK